MKEAVTERLEEYRRQLAAFPAQRAAVEEVYKRNAETLDEAQLLYLHVYAPVLTAYVEWVLEEACGRGQRRLYFCARDAYPMYEAAKYLCAMRGMDMECRYLKVSRCSVRLPEYRLLKERCLERICVGGIGVKLDTVLGRAGLTEPERIEIAAALKEDSMRELSYREIVELKKKLLQVPEFLSYTYAHSKKAYKDTIGYFGQEGLFEEVPYALVDSGWTGTMQQSIQNLLRTRQPPRRMEGYYFGLYELPRRERKDSYHAFYFHPRGGMSRKVYFSNCLFETVYSSAEPMTTGYRRQGGQFVPVQDGCVNPNADTLRKNERVLFEYLQCYQERKKEGAKKRTRMEGAALCERLLVRAMAGPEKWEAEAYGDSLFSDDMSEQGMQSIAAQFQAEEIGKLRLTYRIPVMLGLRKGSFRESAWLEGSIVRSGQSRAFGLQRAAWYKRMIYMKKALSRILGGVLRAIERL